MAAASDIARLRREIETLSDYVEQALRPNAKQPLSATERRTLRSEIQECMQTLDELGTRLSG